MWIMARWTSAAALRRAGRRHPNPQQQAQRIHQEMALAALGFLGRIVAHRATVIGGTNGLTIENAGRGPRAFALGFAPLCPQAVVEGFPQARFFPAAKLAVNGLPRTVFLGQKA